MANKPLPKRPGVKDYHANQELELEAEDFIPIPELPTEATLPGFSMQDDPFDQPEGEIHSSTSSEALETLQQLAAAVAPKSAETRPEAPTVAANAPLEAKIPVREQDIHYESRIRVLEAFQYLGSLKGAPAWIDPNWAAWGEYDEIRKLDAGPALRVPLQGPLAEKLCRRGDYVVQQSVKIANGVEDVRLEVWEKADFEKFFLKRS